MTGLTTMKALTAAAATTTALFAASVATAQSTGSGSCEDVHIFLSRGNNEPYPGRQGALVDAICGGGLDSCDYEDVVFDNALETEYCGAVEAGRAAAVEQITAYNKKCPDSKLVVSGYSQGAHAVGDVLAGGGGVFFQGCVQPDSAGLSREEAPGKMIKAFLMFGNTRHTAGQSYNTLGGSQFNGIFPRPGDMLSAMDAYADVMHDYCQEGDPICTGDNGDVVANHLNYFQIFPPEAAKWVWSMVGQDDDDDDDEPTSSTSSTTSATSTSTTSSTTTAERSSITSSTTSSDEPTTTETSSSTTTTTTTTISSSGMATSTVTKTSTSTTITSSSQPSSSTTAPPPPSTTTTGSGGEGEAQPPSSTDSSPGQGAAGTIIRDRMLTSLAVVAAWFVILA